SERLFLSRIGRSGQRNRAAVRDRSGEAQARVPGDAQPGTSGETFDRAGARFVDSLDGLHRAQHQGARRSALLDALSRAGHDARSRDRHVPGGPRADSPASHRFRSAGAVRRHSFVRLRIQNARSDDALTWTTTLKPKIRPTFKPTVRPTQSRAPNAR